MSTALLRLVERRVKRKQELVCHSNVWEYFLSYCTFCSPVLLSPCEIRGAVMWNWNTGENSGIHHESSLKRSSQFIFPLWFFGVSRSYQPINFRWAQNIRDCRASKIWLICVLFEAAQSVWSSHKVSLLIIPSSSARTKHCSPQIPKVYFLEAIAYAYTVCQVLRSTQLKRKN